MANAPEGPVSPSTAPSAEPARFDGLLRVGKNFLFGWPPTSPSSPPSTATDELAVVDCPAATEWRLMLRVGPFAAPALFTTAKAAPLCPLSSFPLFGGCAARMSGLSGWPRPWRIAEGCSPCPSET